MQHLRECVWTAQSFFRIDQAGAYAGAYAHVSAGCGLLLCCFVAGGGHMKQKWKSSIRVCLSPIVEMLKSGCSFIPSFLFVIM